MANIFAFEPPSEPVHSGRAPWTIEYMKILVSAIACDPLGGSEGAVGWAAVQRICRHHEVRLLTNIQFKDSWHKAQAEGVVPDKLQVRFLGVDAPWNRHRLIARLQSWRRFQIFTDQVLAAALEWHREDPVDLVHQITYATWRVPSPLWQMPVPFVWGPIAGAGSMPARFRKGVSRSGRAFEFARDISGILASRSAAFHKTITNATVVIAANEETESFLRRYRGELPMLRMPVSYVTSGMVDRFRRSCSTPRREGPLRLFAGGNMIGSKGLSLAVDALVLAKQQGLDFHYMIAGGGPEIPAIQAKVERMGLRNEVTFHPGFTGNAYVAALQDADVYFLPSFREALGLTMVEAVVAGCYPLVVDVSMPGEMAHIAGVNPVPVTDVQATCNALAAELRRLGARTCCLASESCSIATRLIDKLKVESFDDHLGKAYSLALQRSGWAGSTGVSQDD